MKKLLNALVKAAAKLESGKRSLNAGEWREAIAVIKRVIRDNPELAKYLFP